MGYLSEYDCRKHLALYNDIHRNRRYLHLEDRTILIRMHWANGMQMDNQWSVQIGVTLGHSSGSGLQDTYLVPLSPRLERLVPVANEVKIKNAPVLRVGHLWVQVHRDGQVLVRANTLRPFQRLRGRYRDGGNLCLEFVMEQESLVQAGSVTATAGTQAVTTNFGGGGAVQPWGIGPEVAGEAGTETTLPQTAITTPTSPQVYPVSRWTLNQV